ncbi:Flp family type IVb pilin [Nocardiopsis mangrovi]|uniref:Flp family type IVb pilin n=1 Tax=Nocardiopsis mangrovi TaxID=1179818 RepID=A0ABV9DPC7_9ACTN
MLRRRDENDPRPARPSHADRGAGMVEYGAVIALIAIVAGVVLTAGIPGRVSGLIEDAVCRVETQEDCTATAAGSDGAADRDGAAGPDGVDPADLRTMAPPPPDGGGGPVCDPLCDPESGDVNLAEWPPPPDHPETGIAIESYEEYDTKNPDDISGTDYTFWPFTRSKLEAKHQAAREWAYGSLLMPGTANSRAALLHFLDGSGETMEIDGDDLMADVPEFREEVESAQDDIGRSAIAEAREQGATGPVTFPFSTEWNAFGRDPRTGEYIYDDSDWINTLGSWNYNQVGEVTVFPPADPEGVWRYEVTSRTNVQKYYDWDPEKTDPAIGVGPIDAPFSEHDLWNMHRTGLAQEFWVEGSTTTTRGGHEG